MDIYTDFDHKAITLLWVAKIREGLHPRTAKASEVDTAPRAEKAVPSAPAEMRRVINRTKFHR